MRKPQKELLTWTEKEDATLIDLRGKGLSYREIARRLNRSHGGVARRFFTLKFTPELVAERRERQRLKAVEERADQSALSIKPDTSHIEGDARFYAAMQAAISAGTERPTVGVQKRAATKFPVRISADYLSGCSSPGGACADTL